jgi:hypothetical protein
MAKTLRWEWALTLVGCLLGGLAHAEEPAASSPPAEAAEIQLKNGDSMRGTIIAVEPGQRVIVIVAGEQSVIPWGDIARIVGGPKEASPSAASTAASPAPAPAAEPVPAKGKPMVHIESDWDDAELSRVDGELGAGMYNNSGQIGPQTLSRYVCRAPCNKLVDGREGHKFFISAPGMFPSPMFRLEDYDGQVTARVHGVSLARYMGGVIMAASGGMFVLGGTMFAGISFISENETPTPENPDPARTARQVRTVGVALAGIGAASLITGIVLLSAGRTRVELIPANRSHTGLVLDHGVLRF